MKRLFDRLSDCKESLTKERNYSAKVKAEREDLKTQLEKLKKDHEARDLFHVFKLIFRAWEAFLARRAGSEEGDGRDQKQQEQ